MIELVLDASGCTSLLLAVLAFEFDVSIFCISFIVFDRMAPKVAEEL